ncbi:GNAT family N-acetyltransferase [Streptomyces meridianus]|uniref:GNAT family N-acetyltransferase n=1 Tax=Streptomyces meridianus TaxID=2938945 RepID=A0ABT0X8B4_9ACTN|nr:GNAT family N-acetyltransferase [Streptomyces meridianus]MCM2578535.1 GNAT family N-acetyltransferase [Streptomyces meridianus]
MDLVLRPGRTEDQQECGRICFEAFSGIAAAYNYPSDMPSEAFATELMGHSLTHPGVYSVVAELDGRIVGSSFLDERSSVAGIGPVSVDPALQNSGVGRRLMQDVMARAADRGAAGVRLVQNAYHCRSFALYAGLGFEFRESLLCLQGPPVGRTFPGYDVREATKEDLAACDDLCRRVHGMDRGAELAEAVEGGTARVVEHAGRITGYATGLSFTAHAVAESSEGIKALIGSADGFEGPGILVPASDSALVQWCLAEGLRIREIMSQMTTGLYNRPAGAWLSSILF